MGSLEHYLPGQNELGETPIWVREENALYWVDIGTHTVYRVDPATAAYESFKPDMPVRGLCRRKTGGWLLITDAGLAFWDRLSNACEFIVDPFADNPDLQFNDGMIDRQGRLVVGSYNSVRLEAADGSLFRLDADRGLHRLDKNLDELYITTAWYNLSEQQRKNQPWAGDLFRINTDVKGIAEPGFAG